MHLSILSPLPLVLVSRSQTATLFFLCGHKKKSSGLATRDYPGILPRLPTQIQKGIKSGLGTRPSRVLVGNFESNILPHYWSVLLFNSFGVCLNLQATYKNLFVSYVALMVAILCGDLTTRPWVENLI